MDRREIIDIVNRIQTETSVLLLGQNYLSYEKHWSFVDNLNKELGTKLKTFSSISSLLRGKDALSCEEVNRAIEKAAGNAPLMSWLRKILFMRWSVIYTSAVDDCITNYDAIGEFMYDLIPADAKGFKREYLSKNRPNIVKLCQNKDNSFETDARKRKELIEERFSWIYRNMINRSGIFVVDGWTPDDMLKSDMLLNISSNMPCYRIFIFGMTSDELLSALENDDERYDQVQEDIEAARIVLIEESFPEALEQCGMFDEDEEDEQHLYSDDYYVVDVKTKGKHSKIDLTCAFDKSRLDRIGRRITLIHNDLVGDYTDSFDSDVSKYFLKFLTQSINIDWNLYNEKFDFYSKRDVDDELFDKVCSQLKLPSYNRKPIILSGPSNSGKTATMINFALRAKREGLSRPSLIFYLSGEQKDDFSDSKTDWISELSELLNAELIEKQKKYDKALNVILIWDNYSDDRIDKYIHLQERMYERNVLVIGSSYHSAGKVETINVDANLSDTEFNTFCEKLNAIKPEWSTYLQSYYKTRDKRIFSILSRIALFENNAEWREMRVIMRERLSNEADFTEHRAGEALEEFDVEDFEDLNELISEYGIGAYTALELERSLGKNEEEDATTRNALEDIKLMNKLLALAGQFSLGLPLSLIMYILYNKNEYTLKKRDQFLKEIISNDSLVIFEYDSTGKAHIRFRHYSEAQDYLARYLERDFPDEEDRKKEEIELLRDLIYSCDWYDNDEAESIIRLIRKFGPNSDGKPGENKLGKQYRAYSNYWKNIVLELDDADLGDNYEAMLVKCHFIRESSFDESEDYNASKLLRDAQTELRRILMNHSTANEAQLSRIGGELCAGLNVEMQKEKNADNPDRNKFLDYFNSFIKYFGRAYYYYKNSTKNKHRASVNSNMLLDIWLNAIEHCRDFISVNPDGSYTDEYKSRIADSLHYVSELLVIDSPGSSEDYDLSGLMNKIDRLFKQANEVLEGKHGNINEYERKLRMNRNDGYVFMAAMQYFIKNAADFEYSEDEDDAKLEKSVLWFLSEEANKYISEARLKQLKAYVKPAAEKAIELFERPENRDLIDRAKSERCKYLYLKAKWLVMTGNLLLEEKQKPALTKDDWRTFGSICDSYIRFSTGKELYVQPAAYLIKAVSEWTYKKVFENNEYPFHALLSYNLTSHLQRIGLCDENGELLRLRIELEVQNGKPKASIKAPLAADNEFFKEIYIKGKKNIPITKAAENTIYKGKEAAHINEYSPVVIWFTSKGPQADVPTE